MVRMPIPHRHVFTLTIAAMNRAPRNGDKMSAVGPYVDLAWMFVEEVYVFDPHKATSGCSSCEEPVENTCSHIRFK